MGGIGVIGGVGRDRQANGVELRGLAGEGADGARPAEIGMIGRSASVQE